MDVLSSLPAFVLAVLLISASPGPAMALIFRRAALRGLRGAVPTVLGLELGLYVLGAVRRRRVRRPGRRVRGRATSSCASSVPASCWCWGSAPSRAAWSGDPVPVEEPRPAGRRWWGAFAEGVVVQLANPKAAVFMIAFYPQFVPADGPVFATTALLGLLQITLETVLYLGLAAGVARAGTWFRRPRIRRRLEAVSGTVLVGLGLRVAASGR